jgi:flagellar biogenesis protein FliO
MLAALVVIASTSMAAENAKAPAKPFDKKPAEQTQTAQSAESAPAAQTSAETMGDDDRLPFMHQEDGEHAAVPSSSESVSTGGIILKTFGAMLIIVGLIFFGAWGLKKFGYGPKSSKESDAPELSVISSITVGSGRTISTVKFGSRVLLVGSTAQSFTLLADGADDEPFPFVGANAPRSVTEMLEAEMSFDQELTRADAGLISLFGGGKA